MLLDDVESLEELIDEVLTAANPSLPTRLKSSVDDIKGEVGGVVGLDTLLIESRLLDKVDKVTFTYSEAATVVTSDDFFNGFCLVLFEVVLVIGSAVLVCSSLLLTLITVIKASVF